MHECIDVFGWPRRVHLKVYLQAGLTPIKHINNLLYFCRYKYILTVFTWTLVRPDLTLSSSYLRYGVDKHTEISRFNFYSSKSFEFDSNIRLRPLSFAISSS